MKLVEHLAGLWGLSLCSWGVYGLYTIICVKRFIIKRYEERTDLGRTIFFSRHMPFAKYMPDFFSSSLYSGHLLSFLWGWRFIKFIKEKRKNVNYFDDIDNPEVVTCHFSSKEIMSVKRVAIIGGILLLHGIAYFIFRSIWPEAFG